MTTLVRLPDQFTPGGVAVETAATPTCCCCCCVASVAAVATALPAGLAQDVRTTGERISPVIAMVPLGGLGIALAPLLAMISGSRAIPGFWAWQVLAFALAGIFVYGVSRAVGSPRPWRSVLRLSMLAPLAVLEMMVVFSAGILWAGFLLAPLMIIAVIAFYGLDKS
ncbi:hypothetical protein GCM10010174_63890 [Kutzneria viridogrisea]|uniref:Uncharacterized protein n=2 Tax=Kutzneria TaxID=43356 RepID=W5WH44_9PSEU|nr:hypothetical protein [Kutzneria albida]AHI00524.1 hypothetical protein KALB_7166 [Kutzneria albida DSM 43870]MBA8925703.1 fatty acid desaturase [Kutzneria viridogrisea]